MKWSHNSPRKAAFITSKKNALTVVAASLVVAAADSMMVSHSLHGNASIVCGVCDMCVCVHVHALAIDISLSLVQFYARKTRVQYI